MKEAFEKMITCNNGKCRYSWKTYPPFELEKKVKCPKCGEEMILKNCLRRVYEETITIT